MIIVVCPIFRIGRCVRADVLTHYYVDLHGTDFETAKWSNGCVGNAVTRYDLAMKDAYRAGFRGYAQMVIHQMFNTLLRRSPDTQNLAQWTLALTPLGWET